MTSQSEKCIHLNLMISLLKKNIKEKIFDKRDWVNLFNPCMRPETGESWCKRCIFELLRPYFFPPRLNPE